MILERENISRLDNDNEYIEFVGSAIKLADPHAHVKLQRTNNKLNVTVSPSNLEFKQHLIDTLLDAHKRLRIVIHFSSSLKISKNIYFYLDI